MPIIGDDAICNRCGIRVSIENMHKGILKFRPYRGDIICNLCLEDIHSEDAMMPAADAPSPADLKEIEPFLDE